MRPFLLTALVLLAPACSESAAPSCCDDAAEAAGATPAPASLYEFDARWTDQHGAIRTLADFAGRPVLLAMFFTSCEYACPRLIADIRHLLDRAAARRLPMPTVVLATFDVDRDTPQALAAWAERAQLPTSGWSLLHGSADSVAELAALLGVRYRRIEDTYSHTSAITLLDSAGHLVHQQLGTAADPEQTLDRLAALDGGGR